MFRLLERNHLRSILKTIHPKVQLVLNFLSAHTICKRASFTKSESNWKTYYNYYKLPYEEFNK